MLSKFRVKGFKGFNEEIELNLENHNDYQFNKNLIKNNIINKALIFGKNASGKTNIGYALFDIIFHLTENEKYMQRQINLNYLNMEGNHKYAEFYYEFKFDNDRLVYKYRKEDINKLIYEELLLNDTILIKYDFNNPSKKIINIEEAKTLNWNNDNNDISIIKYIYNNTRIDKENILNKMMEFVNGMLWFRSIDFNNYIGLSSTTNTLEDVIIKNGKTKDFQKFLEENGIKYNLVELNLPEGKSLGVKIGNKTTTFSSIISSGTSSLWLYYCWELRFSQVKFLFIDEFDSKYHFELSASIVKRLNSKTSFQSILTTHNTYLMSNKLTRPDCTFILTPKSIKSLSSCTKKELREAHNIEKLYREGAFIN